MYLKSAYPTAPCPCVLSLSKELVEKRFVRGFSAIFQSFCHKKRSADLFTTLLVLFNYN
ncbi:hypothetical protein PORCRE_501 [Porphyromonas crevioricanis JCM 15906]|uniref:Uncharacterized protein n=1 Tax=Porphyromonas crevioricanis JCM 15906 TaxID=1305617 RepID=T1DQK3_9PORP|nr:hypothetical protein PORCRE_501 [Porphyromonas crevioricanis JCM 15906]